jgi:hypothetical protein
VARKFVGAPLAVALSLLVFVGRKNLFYSLSRYVQGSWCSTTSDDGEKRLARVPRRRSAPYTWPCGAWRAVHRALARMPKVEADQARQAQLARLQAVRMLLWNQVSADPIRVAEALIKLEARETRLLGLDMP